METVAVAIIAAAVLVFVARPLFGRARRQYAIENAFESAESERLGYLKAKKARVEENLRELEFEHEMGKLAEADYAQIRDGYAKEIEEIEGSLGTQAKTDVQQLIENEVRRRRRLKE